LGEVALAFLGLDVVDIELRNTSSRRTLVQMLLEFFESAAVTLSLTSDLLIEVSVIVMLGHCTSITYATIRFILDVAGDAQRLCLLDGEASEVDTLDCTLSIHGRSFSKHFKYVYLLPRP